MTHERMVTDWLHDEAPPRAPERLLEATVRAVAVRPQERVLWRGRRSRTQAPSTRAQALTLAVIGAGLLGVLAVLASVSRDREPTNDVTNGWVAFTKSQEDPDLVGDIYLVREGRPARRIVGWQGDEVDERCPALSPDGARLAYGRAVGSDYGGRGHTGAALVIADLDPAGNAVAAMEVEVGGDARPPCAIWAPDGRHVAFAVGRSIDSIEHGFTTTTDAVWIVRLEDGAITRVQDTFATDLEWAPDGSRLAIASGTSLQGHRAIVPTTEIRLFAITNAESRLLPGTWGANWISWSPDGRRIAYERDVPGSEVDERELVMHELDGDTEHVIATGYLTNQGIGPAWSPTGDRLVYQRICTTNLEMPTMPCREEHDVVVVTSGPGDSWRAEDVTVSVMPQAHGLGASVRPLWPFRVTWSPDGQSLLYDAFGTLFVVRPSGEGPVSILVEDADPEAGGLTVPIQVWGRRPDGAADMWSAPP
jgi:Tol biopolymer transport system component